MTRNWTMIEAEETQESFIQTESSEGVLITRIVPLIHDP